MHVDPRAWLFLSAEIFFASAMALAAVWFVTRSQRTALRRLHRATRPQPSAQAVAQAGPMAKLGLAVAAQLHSLRLRFGGGESSSLADRIRQAGFRGSLAFDCYVASRVLFPVVGLLIGSAIPYNRGFWMLSLPAVAYLAPDMLLQHGVRRYRNRIQRTMPDAVDLLVICVDAGLGLDQALLRVAEELHLSHPEVSSELLQINNEQRAGKPRVDAWADMGKRVDLPEVHALINMLIQTERFGTPIARALTQFAASLRTQRRQRAEEKAAKTTVKIIFPLVLFIFPSIFIVLLGPAILTILRGFAGMGQ